MKRIVYLAVAAVALISCRPSELTVFSPAPSDIFLTLCAEMPQTRTFIEAVDGGWQPKWQKGDALTVTYEFEGDYDKQKTFSNIAEDGLTGTFTGKLDIGDGSHTIYAYYPKAMKNGRDGTTFKFALPPVQTIPGLTSFDPAADLLVSEGTPVTIEGGKVTSSGKMQFHRPLAIAKVAVKDATTDGRLSGKKIKAVSIKSADAVLSGRVGINITTGAITSWESKSSYKYVGAEYKGDDWTADGTAGAFIILNPVTLTAGSTLTAEVTTDDPATYVSRSVKLSSDMSFQPGRINSLVFKIDDDDFSGSAAGGGDLECTDPPATGDIPADKLYGYAEAAGVTGGEGASGAKVLHFDNGKALQTWLLARTKSEKNGDKSPVIIWLSGTFGPGDGRDFSEGHPWFDVKDVSNLSFYGTDGFVCDRIGFFAVRASNIVFRNINFLQPKANNGADALSLQQCDGVWIDHCTFTSLNQAKDYEDGSTDITHGSKNVTVSWCRYIKTQKSCLVGHSNSQSGDKDITVTFHHNWFEKSSSRHPRVRFGRAHVYNNFYDGCTTYGAGSAYGAMVLVEYNCFDGVQLPTDICTFPAKESNESNLQGSVAGYLYPTENVYLNRPAKAKDPYPLSNVRYTSYGGGTITPLTYSDFKPAYSYTVTAAADVASVVTAGAGYGKLGWTEAPVAVNNGGISEFQGSDPDDPDPGNPDDPDDPEPAGGSHVHVVYYDSSGALANLTDGAAGSYFTATAKADLGSDYSQNFNPWTIGAYTSSKGIKMNSSGKVTFTTSATLNSTVQFWFIRRKSGDSTAKIQITPSGGEAQVFDSPYDTLGDSGEIALAKGTAYTIAQKAKEQALLLVIVKENE